MLERKEKLSRNSLLLSLFQNIAEGKSESGYIFHEWKHFLVKHCIRSLSPSYLLQLAVQIFRNAGVRAKHIVVRNLDQAGCNSQHQQSFLLLHFSCIYY